MLFVKLASERLERINLPSCALQSSQNKQTTRIRDAHQLIQLPIFRITHDVVHRPKHRRRVEKRHSSPSSPRNVSP